MKSRPASRAAAARHADSCPCHRAPALCFARRLACGPVTSREPMCQVAQVPSARPVNAFRLPLVICTLAALCSRRRRRLRREIHHDVETVVTRFAPSPHGLPAYWRRPHRAVQLALRRAGAAARCCCGSRTPTASARPNAAIDAILDGLAWLGLAWDGDAVYQFSRAARHREVVEQLLAAGQAYHCCATPEELDRDARAGAQAKAAPALRRALARPRPGGGRRPASSR